MPYAFSPVGQRHAGFLLMELVVVLTLGSAFMLGVMQLHQVLERSRSDQQLAHDLRQLNEDLYAFFAVEERFPVDVEELSAAYQRPAADLAAGLSWSVQPAGLALRWQAGTTPLARRIAARFGQAERHGDTLHWWLSVPWQHSWQAQFVQRATATGDPVTMATDLWLAGHDLNAVGHLQAQSVTSTALTGDYAQVGALYSEQLATDALTAGHVEIGQVRAGQVSGNHWQGAMMAVDQLWAEQLEVGELTLVQDDDTEVRLSALAHQLAIIEQLWQQCVQQGRCQ